MQLELESKQSNYCLQKSAIDTRDMILTPDQLCKFMNLLGTRLRLTEYLGMKETMPAGFISPEDFGTLQYGSELMNVTFDPNGSYEMASYRFDDTGVEATSYLKDGKLLRGWENRIPDSQWF